jgi:hypothetical protein
MQHAPKSNKTQIMKVRQVQQGLSNRLLSLSFNVVPSLSITSRYQESAHLELVNL